MPDTSRKDSISQWHGIIFAEDTSLGEYSSTC